MIILELQKILNLSDLLGDTDLTDDRQKAELQFKIKEELLFPAEEHHRPHFMSLMSFLAADLLVMSSDWLRNPTTSE